MPPFPHPSTVRPPAVAGAFYPDPPDALRHEVREALRLARGDRPSGRVKAVIAPHAGYRYSGPVAGSAFAALRPDIHPVRRVVLLGPSHHVAFRGVAASGHDAFDTPLGRVPVDAATRDALVRDGLVRVFEPAHAVEHSLEVELPFLQERLPAFDLLPLVTGSVADDALDALFDRVWGDGTTLLVISSDLSHYLTWEQARALDARTCAAVEALDPVAVADDQACGAVPLRGLLRAARRHGLRATTLDLRNSGDTAGGRQRVVGYGAWAFT